QRLAEWAVDGQHLVLPILGDLLSDRDDPERGHGAIRESQGDHSPVFRTVRVGRRARPGTDEQMTDLGDASIHACEVLSMFEQVGLVAAVSPRRVLRVLTGEARGQVTALIPDPGQLPLKSGAGSGGPLGSIRADGSSPR